MNDTKEGTIRVTVKLRFDARGLIPVITQDCENGDVLMMAWMNREALEKTRETGLVHYYSRTRRSLWLKGETSGHFQHVADIRTDCDGDALLIKARQEGCACHTGHRSCFFSPLLPADLLESQNTGAEETTGPEASAATVTPEETVTPENAANILAEVYEVIQDRKQHPREGSYTTKLLTGGLDRILKKVGEEATEVVLAAKNGSREEISLETADLLYHLMVMMAAGGVTWEDIFAELRKRR